VSVAEVLRQGALRLEQRALGPLVPALPRVARWPLSALCGVCSAIQSVPSRMEAPDLHPECALFSRDRCRRSGADAAFYPTPTRPPGSKEALGLVM